MSVVAAAITKYGTLSIPGSPPLYFDGVPQTGAGGAILDLPWVNLVDESGTSPEQGGQSGFDFEYNPIEETTLRFEVYAITLSEVDLIMNGIKYSSGAFNAKLGFDFGTLTITNQVLKECRRTHEHRARMPQLEAATKYVHQGQIWYAIQTQVTGP